MDTIWLIMESYGDWEDYSNTAIGYELSEKDAEFKVSLLNTELDALKKANAKKSWKKQDIYINELNGYGYVELPRFKRLSKD